MRLSREVCCWRLCRCGRRRSSLLAGRSERSGPQLADARGMLTQERLAVSRIPECLRASRASDGERAGTIGKFQTVFNLCPANELVNESRVKRIARPDGIHDIHYRWKRHVSFFANAGHCALRPALDHQDPHFLRERLSRLLDIFSLSQLA